MWEISESLNADHDRSNLFCADRAELLSTPVRNSNSSPSWLPSLSIVADETPTFNLVNQDNTAQSSMLCAEPTPRAEPLLDAYVDDNLPQLSIDDRDRFLEKLCAAAQSCPKSNLAVSNLVQEINGMVGFGAVLSALTIYANLHE